MRGRSWSGRARRREAEELAQIIRRRRLMRRRQGVAGVPVEDQSTAPIVPQPGPVGPVGPQPFVPGNDLNDVLCMPTTEGVIQHLTSGSFVCRDGQWRQLIYG